jgi:MSHA biogenesis protein MshO
MVIVMMGVIGGMVAVFMKSPIDAYFATARRAGLTDVADTVVRRMARDIQRALPNSLRMPASQCVELIPTKTGGRYRSDAGGAGDKLDFSTADTSFNMLGSDSAWPVSQRIVAGDLIVIFNLGITGANAYDVGTSTVPTNWTTVSASAPSPLALSGTPSETVIPMDAKKFPLESPNKRFQVISKDEQVLRFVCLSAGTNAQGTGTGSLVRQVLALPLAETTACPTTAASAGVVSSAVMANQVSACSFDYSGNDLQRNALLSMKFTVADTGESVGLQHEVNVNNAP